MKDRRYVCVGDIRGWCGTRHRTIEAACTCQQRDQSACARQGGYSDRAVYQANEIHQRGDGEDYYLSSSRPNPEPVIDRWGTRHDGRSPENPW